MTRTLQAATALTMVLSIGACGTSAAPSTSVGPPASAGMPTLAATAATTATSNASPAVTGAATASTTATTTAADTWTPGSIRYRVANVGTEPVDVYVRSQGLVQAWPVKKGLARGESTEYVAPPDPGTLVVTAAGAADPTCVSSCADFIGSWSNTAGTSTQSTISVHSAGATELWEQPKPELVGSVANALQPANPASGLVFASGEAVTGAEFGLRLSFRGEPGCQVDVGTSGQLIGGTSVLPFAFADSVEVLVHPNTDSDCSASPIGGPFVVAGENGSRALVLLYGSMESMSGLVLPIP